MSKKKKDKKGFKLTRRDFIKSSIATGAAGTMADWAVVGPNPALALTYTKGYYSVCPYCSGGCGMIAAVDGGGSLVDIFGDKENPFNWGALCCKGRSFMGINESSNRETEPAVKVDGTWYQTTWAEMFNDATFSKGGKTIPSLTMAMGDTKYYFGPDSLAFYGSSHLTNEECYLLRKLIGVLGTSNTEHQARI